MQSGTGGVANGCTTRDGKGLLLAKASDGPGSRRVASLYRSQSGSVTVKETKMIQDSRPREPHQCSQNCYAYPSSGEGWSFTPRESLFLGVPTVVSAIPVHAELRAPGSAPPSPYEAPRRRPSKG